jgi:tetratricopeptide (TPR) repeat protein
MAVWNVNADRPERGDTAATRAYELRSQVGDRERWLIEGVYHAYVSGDEEAEENAYLSLLDKYPNDPTALNNQAINYRAKGRRSEAAELLLRSVRNGGAPGVTYIGLLDDLGNLGRLDEAGEVLDKFKADFPTHPQLGGHEVRYFYNRGDVDAAEQRAMEWLDEAAGNPQFAADPFEYLASFASLRGRVDENLRHVREAANLQIEWAGDRLPPAIRENLEENIDGFMRIADVEARLWYGTSPRVTAELVETEVQLVRELFLRQRLPDSLFPTREFLTMFARLGEADRAQDMLSEMRRRDAESEEPVESWHWRDEEAIIAMARGQAADAARLYRELRDAWPTCDLPTCLLFEIGTAFDSAGMTDSALVYFERYLTEPAWSRISTDARNKPVVLRRLGELYEAKGDSEQALDYYGRLVELWADADPGLQPLVEDVRGRIARLLGENR